jgi:hypothetical protein
LENDKPKTGNAKLEKSEQQQHIIRREETASSSKESSRAETLAFTLRKICQRVHRYSFTI